MCSGNRVSPLNNLPVIPAIFSLASSFHTGPLKKCTPGRHKYKLTCKAVTATFCFGHQTSVKIWKELEAMSNCLVHYLHADNHSPHCRSENENENRQLSHRTALPIQGFHHSDRTATWLVQQLPTSQFMNACLTYRPHSRFKAQKRACGPSG